MVPLYQTFHILTNTLLFLSIKERDALTEIVEEMLKEAKRDMEGEGFEVTAMESELDFTLYNKKDSESIIRFSSSYMERVPT